MSTNSDIGSKTREHPVLTRRRKSRSERDQAAVLRLRRMRVYRTRVERESATEDSNAETGKGLWGGGNPSEEDDDDDNDNAFEDNKASPADGYSERAQAEETSGVNDESVKAQERFEQGELDINQETKSPPESYEDEVECDKQASLEETDLETNSTYHNTNYGLNDSRYTKRIERSTLQNDFTSGNGRESYAHGQKITENHVNGNDTYVDDDNTDETEDSSMSIPEIEVQSTKPRAQSARDLVRSQEKLLAMLQDMKTDICRMDRQASCIKEDVVRSKQMFNIVYGKKEAHHLPLSPDGFNISYSIPRVTYPTYSNFRDKPIHTRYLHQLSSNGLNSGSRRSSVSSNCSYRSSSLTRQPSYDVGYRDSSTSRRIGRQISPSRSTTDNYSGTESDMETSSPRVRRWQQRQRNHTLTSENDSDSMNGGGSSTESASTHLARLSYQGRRASYFFTERLASPQHSNTDEVDM